jgi:mannose-6-phosphate isomerase-like protein (cupin superfamily)
MAYGLAGDFGDCKRSLRALQGQGRDYEKGMFYPTRRDFAVMALTLIVAGGLLGLSEPKVPTPPVNAKPILGSSAFDWEQLVVKTTKVGAMRKVCQAPTATLDELECHVTTLNRGEWAHPAHQHLDEELIIVKEGTVEALVAGTWTKLGPGSVIFQASNIEHAIRNAGETSATYHVIKWNPPGMLKQKAEAAAAAKAK